MHSESDSDSSAASFEDVGAPRASRPPRYPDLVHIPGRRVLDEDEVVDVLYTAQYCSSSGRVIESRQSDKPLENVEFGKDNQGDGKKKPVIEIVTRHSVAKSSPKPRYRHDDGYDSPDDCYGSSGMPDDTKMIIHSKYLQAALSAVIGYYPGFERLEDHPSIPAPYQVLVHNWKALEHYKLNQPSCHSAEYVAATAKDIDVLLKFLTGMYSEKLAAEARRWDNASGATATFDLFWVLLKPGEFVYREIYGEMVPFVVSSALRTPAGDGTARSTYRVNLWNVHYQNHSMRRRMTQVAVFPWNGEQLITTLPVIPVRFVKGGAKAMVDEQIRLGRIYWELAKQPSYREYSGKLVFKHDKQGGKITGRVIVDCEGFAQYGEGPPKPGPFMPPPRPHHHQVPVKEDQLPQNQSRCSCNACSQSKQEPSPWAGFDNLNPNEDSLPANQELYFHAIGPSIAAFILSERRWGHVSISGLSDVHPDQDAFKYLVLDPEIKLTVKAMMGKFASLDGKLAPWPSDFVKNKGEGRIFLLHGSPGVGKTCTAECAAELARRPLLALTSGDISTSMVPSAVEGALNYFLNLGERFGALVLLDEADVYLEQRRARDLQRNGLVSIFLRALEYYRGVLFLTTNRVEAFDDAFTSRIHVALHYKRLGEEERSKIWQQNFERLQRDSSNQVFVPQATREYAFESADMRALRWNGREIRNALQTAVALAETEALEDGLETITVQDRHLRAVVRMSTGFKQFMSKRREFIDDGPNAVGYEQDDEDNEEDEEYDAEGAEIDE